MNKWGGGRSTARIVEFDYRLLINNVSDALQAVHDIVQGRFKRGYPYITKNGDSIKLHRSYQRAKPDQNILFPIGMIFIRGDRGGGGRILTDEVVSSLKYWHFDSGRYIDFIFPGWRKPCLSDEDKPYIEQQQEKALVFDTKLFIKMRDEVQNMSKWKYSGETDILLLNYVLNPARTLKKHQRRSHSRYLGYFSFRETMTLNVEKMIRDKICPSIDALMQEIISVSKNTEGGGVWEMSDRFAYQRGGASVWKFLKKKFTRGLSEIYDELKPFAVCNLEGF